MPLVDISIRRFRNIEAADIALAPGLTLWVGSNGQGKTNGLEAIYVLMTGRSFRPGTEADWTQAGSTWMALEGHWRDREGSVSTLLRHRVQWQPARRREREGRAHPVVLFSPDDLELIKGGPEGRRRYLDELLVMVDPHYQRALKLFQRGLAQRNRALKERLGWAVVDRFADLMAEPAVYLWGARRHVIAQIQPWLEGFQSEVGAGERVGLDLKWGGTTEPATSAEKYLALLHGRRRDEETRGMTLVGPHRDDLLLTLNGQASQLYASQGQQRTIALGLKLATHHIIVERVGYKPLTLLDDVLSELDGLRRRRLLALIASHDQQTVVTDIGGESYRELGPWMYRVEGGRFERVQ